mgnify:CR=1 FL=1
MHWKGLGCAPAPACPQTDHTHRPRTANRRPPTANPCPAQTPAWWRVGARLVDLQAPGVRSNTAAQLSFATVPQLLHVRAPKSTEVFLITNISRCVWRWAEAGHLGVAKLQKSKFCDSTREQAWAHKTHAVRLFNFMLIGLLGRVGVPKFFVSGLSLCQKHHPPVSPQPRHHPRF